MANTIGRRIQDPIKGVSYHHGAGYVLNSAAVARLLRCPERLTSRVHENAEDYFTALCLREAGVFPRMAPQSWRFFERPPWQVVAESRAAWSGGGPFLKQFDADQQLKRALEQPYKGTLEYG